MRRRNLSIVGLVGELKNDIVREGGEYSELEGVEQYAGGGLDVLGKEEEEDQVQEGSVVSGQSRSNGHLKMP